MATIAAPIPTRRSVSNSGAILRYPVRAAVGCNRAIDPVARVVEQNDKPKVSRPSSVPLPKLREWEEKAAYHTLLALWSATVRSWSKNLSVRSSSP